MARGWESKAVEEQVAENEARPRDIRKTIDGGRERNRQELELQKERILSERTASPHRRAALASALEAVEARLRAL